MSSRIIGSALEPFERSANNIGMTINLLVIDCPVVCAGVASLLKSSKIEVSEGKAVGKSKPDVVLLGTEKIDALEQLIEAHPKLPVIVFASCCESMFVSKVVSLGDDHLPKYASKVELKTAIERVAKGEPSLNPLVVSALLGRNRREYNPKHPLTPRELEVLEQVATGLTNIKIGKKLSLSVETIKEHVQNILRKLGVGDRTQAAVWAVKEGLA